MTNLSGKVALVTGAGGMTGIGRAIALKLAANGADLVISDIRREQTDLPPQEVRAQWGGIDSVAAEVRALGRQCHTLWCDLAVSAQVAAMVEKAIARFGHLDILINNARAITGPDVVPLVELKEEVWRRSLEINTTAVYIAMQCAARAMIRQRRGGAIVNVGSEASRRGIAGMAAYSASKFAVIGLSQSAALELAPHGIRVNTVCPGATDTGRMNYWERDQAREHGVSLEDFRASAIRAAARTIPMGRIGESEDVADAVAFLAGEEAAFITGQTLHVNGGTLLH